MLRSYLPGRAKNAAKRMLGITPWKDPNPHKIPLSILRWITPGRPITLIDVGAFDGSFTEIMTLHYGVSRGLMVEPMSHKANMLRQKYPSSVYSVAECAVSSSNGKTRFEMHEAEDTSSILAMRRDLPELAAVDAVIPMKIIECDCRTLDSLASELMPDLPVDLIKIDVQGVEVDALRGATDLLRRTSALFVEVSFRPLYHGSCVFSDVYSCLDGSGLKLVDIEQGYRAPDGELVQADALFLRVKENHA